MKYIIPSLSLFLLASVSMAQTPTRVWFDLPYMKPADEVRRLDVYAPEGKNLPIVVWVHGGSWVRGDKTFAQHKPRAFTSKGFVFVSVNYRLVPKVKAGDQAADVAHAVAYVHKHAEAWGGDSKNIFIMGHSAGTHLSSLVCTDGAYLKAAGLSLHHVRGCVAVDVAGYDIPARYQKSGPGLKKTLAEIFGDDEEAQRNVSPLHHVAKGKGIPPFLVIHIGVDPQKSQSEAFGKKLAEAGVSVKIHVAQGKGHKKLDEQMGLAGDGPTQAVFSFLSMTLKSIAK